jgi:hypothetical protein
MISTTKTWVNRVKALVNLCHILEKATGNNSVGRTKGQLLLRHATSAASSFHSCRTVLLVDKRFLFDWYAKNLSIAFRSENSEFRTQLEDDAVVVLEGISQNSNPQTTHHFLTFFIGILERSHIDHCSGSRRRNRAASPCDW